jgi:FG-GAP repeat
LFQEEKCAQSFLHRLQQLHFATGAAPQAVSVADFNGDGKLDLAIANYQDGSLIILLGKGDGTFMPASGLPFAVGGRRFQRERAARARSHKFDWEYDFHFASATMSVGAVTGFSRDG